MEKIEEANSQTEEQPLTREVAQESERSRLSEFLNGAKARVLAGMLATATLVGCNEENGAGKNKDSAPEPESPRPTMVNQDSKFTPESAVQSDGSRIEVQRYQGHGINMEGKVKIYPNGETKIIERVDLNTGSGRRTPIAGTERMENGKRIHTEKQLYVGHGMRIVGTVDVDEDGNVVRIIKREVTKE